jgi:hypothetical protein
MQTVTIAGIVLVIMGVVSFSYQGITYTAPQKVIDTGSTQVFKEETHHVPFPVVLGGLFIVGGIVLLVTGIREATKL